MGISSSSILQVRWMHAHPEPLDLGRRDRLAAGVPRYDLPEKRLAGDDACADGRREEEPRLLRLAAPHLRAIDLHHLHGIGGRARRWLPAQLLGSHVEV